MSLTAQQKWELYGRIFGIIKEKGFKQTTMDLIASRLQISKRTLYEIFGSKDEMIAQVLEYFAEIRRMNFEKIVNDSPDVLTAIFRIFNVQRSDIAQLNVNFFHDMDRLYKRIRPQYEKRIEEHDMHFAELMAQGHRQNLLRDDINFTIVSRMIYIQMEALKRMEEFFPPKISFVEIYDTIFLTFLRGIVTEKGHRRLEELIKESKSLKAKTD